MWGGSERGDSLTALPLLASYLLPSNLLPLSWFLVDSGDFVVVTNARHIGLTGKKAEQKMYRWHSQYPGGLKEVVFNDFIQKHPTGVRFFCYI